MEIINELQRIEEISLSISAGSFNANIVNLDFLHLIGVIPTQWQLAREPITVAGNVQLIFQNGVRIFGTQNIITFVENIPTQNEQKLYISELAKKLTEKLSHAQYQIFSFKPKILIPINDGLDSAKRYILNTFLSPGSWQEIGSSSLRASLNLSYQLEFCQLNLAINEANMQLPESSPVSAILFAGSFDYEINQKDVDISLRQLHQYIERWELDLNFFRDTINQYFWISNQSIFPGSFNLR